MKTLIFFFSFTFVISIFFGCENSVNCVEEFAGIQEIIAPDTVNLIESMNLEIVYWFSHQTFERYDESSTDSTISIDIVVHKCNNPDMFYTDEVTIDTFRNQINFTKKGKFKIIVNDSSKIKEIEVM